MNLKNIRFLFVPILLIFGQFQLNAQVTISGPTTGYLGFEQEFTASNGLGSTYIDWRVTGGNVVSFTGSSVIIEWTTTGRQTIEYWYDYEICDSYDGRCDDPVESKEDSFTVTVYSSPAPSSPTVRSAADITDNSFLARWNEVSGQSVTHYLLDVSRSSSFTSNNVFTNRSVTGTTYSVTGLLDNTTYYYRVQAVNDGGSSSESSYQSVTTDLSGSYISGPTSGKKCETDSYTFNASNVLSTSYIKWRVSGGNIVSYTNTTATIEWDETGTQTIEYWYDFQICDDDDGNGTDDRCDDPVEELQASYTVSVGNPNVPSRPGSASVSDVSTNSFDISWGAVDCVTGYQLLVYDGGTQVKNLSYGENTTSSVVTGLSSGTTFTYELYAKNEGGSSSARSGSVTTDPIDPYISGPSSGKKCETDSYTFNASNVLSTSYIKWRVSGGNIVSYTNTTATIEWDETGTQTIEYWYDFQICDDDDGNGTDDRCDDPVEEFQASYTVSVGNPNAPSRPGSASVSDVSTNSFDISWGAVDCVTGYQLLVYDGGTQVKNLSYGENTTSAVVTGLSSGTAFTYELYAKNEGGSSSARSGSVTTDPIDPYISGPSSGKKCETDSYTFNASNVLSTSYIKWRVSGGNIVSYTNTTATIEWDETGTQTIEYWYDFQICDDDDGNGTDDRCDDPVEEFQASYTVSVGNPNAPSRPGSASVSDVSTNSFDISWGAVDCVTGYQLLVYDGGTQVKNLSYGENTTSAVVTGLSDGTTFTYELYAKNEGGSSSARSGSFTTDPIVSYITGPTSVKKCEVDSYDFNSLNTLGDSYIEWRVSGGNVISYTETNVVIEWDETGIYTIEYWYDFQICDDDDGNGTDDRCDDPVEEFQASYTVSVGNPNVPSRPDGVSVSNLTLSGFDISWIPVNCVTGYQLLVYDGGEQVRNLSYNENTTSAVVTGLLDDTKYSYELYAINESGSSKAAEGTVKTLQLPKLEGLTAAFANIQATYRLNNPDDQQLESGDAEWRISPSNGRSIIYSEGEFINILWEEQGYYTVSYVIVREDCDEGRCDDPVDVQTFSLNVEVSTLGLPPNSIIATAPQLETTEVNDDKEENIITIEYIDGIGRPKLTVSQGSSPAGFDVIQPIYYDDYGRVTKEYLHAPTNRKDGSYSSTAESDVESYYQSVFGEADGSNPYLAMRYEDSPLQRVLEEGQPGADWSIGAHTLKYEHSLNTSLDEVIDWDFNTLLTADKAFYIENKLYKKGVTEEEDNPTFEFTNAFDQTILKKSYEKKTEKWAETYYIYDDFGQLRIVLPPQAVTLLDEDFFAAGSDRQTFLDLWTFQYEYDERSRMKVKRVPGAEPVYMVYDKHDRLILTQDGEQRLDNEWLFTKYDALNRPIMTGVMESTLNEDELEAAINSKDMYETFDVSGTHQYSDNSFPTNDDVEEYLTITYYDNYAFVDGLDDLSEATFSATAELTASDDFHILPEENTLVKGQVTGTKTKVLEADEYLETITYYDDKYRVIQVVSGNEVGGTDVISSQYDFVDNVRRVKSVHTDDAIGETTVLLEYDYDHANRLLSCDHQLNDSPKVRLYTNEYNELGELIDKKLHSLDGGNTYSQSVDYEYNIRGWLTKINEASTGGITETPEITLPDVFGMELYYNEAPVLSTN